MTERTGPHDSEARELDESGLRTAHRTDPSGARQPARERPRTASGWAAKIDRLAVPRRGSRGANVSGRRLTGPVQGFGKMWQKTYRMDVGDEVSPQAAIASWKAHFADFWPPGNRFDGPLTGISPGDVAVLDVAIGGGVKLSTGVFVLYADEVSFTLMTPQGHMFAGWITFSAEDGGTGSAAEAATGRATVVQVQVLMRANDPIYELAMSLGGHRKEDQFWIETLTALGTYLGAPPAAVETRTVCIDPRRQWRNFGSVWQNSMVRSILHQIAGPVTAYVRRHRREA
jgi:hypothetical protein